MGNCDLPLHGSLLCFTCQIVYIFSIIWHLVSFRCCLSKIWSLAVPLDPPTEYVQNVRAPNLSHLPKAKCCF